MPKHVGVMKYCNIVYIRSACSFTKTPLV